MVMSMEVVPTANVLKNEDSNTVAVDVGAVTVVNCGRQ